MIFCNCRLSPWVSTHQKRKYSLQNDPHFDLKKNLLPKEVTTLPEKRTHQKKRTGPLHRKNAHGTKMTLVPKTQKKGLSHSKRKTPTGGEIGHLPTQKLTNLCQVTYLTYSLLDQSCFRNTKRSERAQLVGLLCKCARFLEWNLREKFSKLRSWTRASHKAFLPNILGNPKCFSWGQMRKLLLTGQTVWWDGFEPQIV